MKSLTLLIKIYESVSAYGITLQQKLTNQGGGMLDT